MNSSVRKKQMRDTEFLFPIKSFKVMMDSDSINPREITYGRSKDIAETDWTWMNKYVNATQWLKELRK